MPNWASSTAPAGFAGYVSPLIATKFEGLEPIKQVVLALPRTRLIEETESYLYFQQSSWLFGFIDDIEIHRPAGSEVIHLRSASRLGYYDAGVNKARIEKLKADLAS